MNNIKHIWSILCERSSIDQNTNNISLFNVLEQINVDKKVLEMAKTSQKSVIATINYQLITLWQKEAEKKKINFEQKIEVVDANGKILASAPKRLEIPASQTRIRAINNFEGLPITGMGEYAFKIYLKDEYDEKYKIYASIPLVLTEVNNTNLKPA
jgi:hypothetical protein